jgi:hypothetical protein
MAVESKTVGYLTSRVYMHMGGSSTVPTSVGNEIKNALGWAMRELVFLSAHPAFRVEAITGGTPGGITTASGTADYEMATDFMMLIEPSFRHNSDPKETLAIVDMQEYDRVGGSKVYETNGRPVFFSLLGRSASTGQQKVKFVPTPDAAYNIEYRYIAIPKDINASTGDSVEVDARFPRHHVEGIVDGALTRFASYLERDQLATAMDRFAKAARRMREDAKPVRGRSWQNRRYYARHNVVPAHSFSGLTAYSE